LTVPCYYVQAIFLWGSIYLSGDHEFQLQSLKLIFHWKSCVLYSKTH